MFMKTPGGPGQAESRARLKMESKENGREGGGWKTDCKGEKRDGREHNKGIKKGHQMPGRDVTSS